jgi:hypothetical protein
LIAIRRCLSPAKELEKGDGRPRTRAFDETARKFFERDKLWKKFGIVADVLVSLLSLIPLLVYTNTHLKPFTSSFPRADIHELITPDLLHQVIKGAFKDHITTWVNEYIKQTNTAEATRRIIDDIDRK